MFGIGKFFSKIQGAYAKEILVRKEIQSALKKVAGINVKIEDISFKDSVVELKGISSTAKSVLYTKKSAVLKELESIKHIRAVTDFR